MTDQKIKTDCGAADLKNQFNCNAVSENLQAKSDFRIPPYRLTVLFDHANKALKMIASAPTWLVSGEEIEFILEVMLDTVRKANGKHSKDEND